MLSLLERNIASIERRLVLVAPPHEPVPSRFRHVTVDGPRHEGLVSEIQRLRGDIYLTDGAIRPDDLTSSGRHRTPEDERSWHLIMFNRQQQISSCTWYMEHPTPADFETLRVHSCPLAADDQWRKPLSDAVAVELDRAHRHGLRYAEVGGWAVSPKSRCTAEGLLLALAAYSLGRFFGGALGLTTATRRHGSATILRRLGARCLSADGQTLPSYYDPRYECQMELLSFDSRRTNPKYDRIIDAIKDRLADVRVVAAPCATGGAAVQWTAA